MSVDPISGCLLGTALGDALGLPYEGLSRRRALRLLGRPDRFRFNFGRGMVSDDTEHTCMVAQALISSGGSLEDFRPVSVLPHCGQRFDCGWGIAQNEAVSSQQVTVPR